MVKILRATHNLDAKGEVLGRFATKIARLLMGKNKVTYVPHIDGGDIVKVANIGALAVTGQKASQKVYYHFSGYPGGIKSKKFSEMWEKNPADVLFHAVERMLPKNKLRKGMLKRLVIQK